MKETELARRLIVACSKKPQLKKSCFSILKKLSSVQEGVSDLQYRVRRNPGDSEARERLFQIERRTNSLDMKFWKDVGLFEWLLGKFGQTRNMLYLRDLREENKTLNDLDENFYLKLKRNQGWLESPRQTDPIDGGVSGGHFMARLFYPKSPSPNLVVLITENLVYVPPKGRSQELWDPVSYDVKVSDLRNRRVLGHGRSSSFPGAKRVALGELDRVLNENRMERAKRERDLEATL